MVLAVYAFLALLGAPIQGGPIQGGPIQGGLPQGSPPAQAAAGAVAGAQDAAPPTVEPGHEKDIKLDEDLGAKLAAEVDKENKPTDDLKMQARVERIGDALAKVADTHRLIALWGDKRFSPFHYHFKVIKGDDVNAFSIRGGYIYVYEGLVKYVESDDELAGVLGHEISHAALRHQATLNKKSNQLLLASLPLVLAGLLTSGGGGGDLIGLTALLNQAAGSGWSVDAEKAADYGGFQLLVDSGKYNPVGLLTFMERLARDEFAQPGIVWGIYRDHPPSAERARTLIKELNDAHIPIDRSKVTTSFCAKVTPEDGGVVAVTFDKVRIFGFAGPEALKRADEASVRINAFCDAVPELYQAKLGDDGDVYGLNRKLFDVTDDDAKAAGLTLEALGKQALAQVRGALFSLNFSHWESTN